MVHAGKLGQVTNFTIVDDNAKHCVDKYMVLFRYCSLEGDAAMPGGLHARLCHAFLLSYNLSKLAVFGSKRVSKKLGKENHPVVYFVHLN